MNSHLGPIRGASGRPSRAVPPRGRTQGSPVPPDRFRQQLARLCQPFQAATCLATPVPVGVWSREIAAPPAPPTETEDPRRDLITGPVEGGAPELGQLGQGLPPGGGGFGDPLAGSAGLTGLAPISAGCLSAEAAKGRFPDERMSGRPGAGSGSPGAGQPGGSTPAEGEVAGEGGLMPGASGSQAGAGGGGASTDPETAKTRGGLGGEPGQVLPGGDVEQGARGTEGTTEGEESAAAAGIPSADLRETMLHADSMTDSSASLMQELPGPPVADPAGREASGREDHGANDEVDPAGGGGAAALAAARYVGLHPGEETSAAAKESLGMEATDRVEATERLAELVESAVAKVRRNESGDYEVELRPDGQTELLLRVRMVDGTAEVEAELRRGDESAFGDRWRELEQRLAQQGVRFTGWSHGQAHSQPQGRGRGRGGGGDETEDPSIEFDVVTASPNTASSRARSARSATVGAGVGRLQRAAGGAAGFADPWETWA